MGRIVVATLNAGKFREIREILRDIGAELVSLADFPEIEPIAENGATFEENALSKAREASIRTGLPAIADDSGLEVFALNGAPGIRSARYAGEPADDKSNNAKLLADLNGVEQDKRGCRFVCVACMYDPQGKYEFVRGECLGRILTAPRGCAGFGYDPLFLVPELGLTMAELPLVVKNRISHRARAFAEVKRLLPGFLGGQADA